MAVKLSLILVTLLIITHTHQTTAYITLTQIRTLVSLSHSLSTRVALLRSTRGDDEGAHRAQLIANKLQFGLGPRFWPTLFSMGWDYFRNYAWHDTLSFKDAVRVVSDLNELLNSFAELTRSKNDFERSAWVAKNYRHVLRISKSLTGRFRSVFTKSETYRIGEDREQATKKRIKNPNNITVESIHPINSFGLVPQPDKLSNWTHQLVDISSNTKNQLIVPTMIEDKRQEGRPEPETESELKLVSYNSGSTSPLVIPTRIP